MDLRVGYDEEVDILRLYTGVNIAVSSSIDFGLVADYGSEDGYDVVGIELMSAKNLIAPLCAGSSKDLLGLREIESKGSSWTSEYDPEADVLRIGTAREVEFPYRVSDALIAHMGFEDRSNREAYDLVGFELHNASEYLAPYFKLNRSPLATAEEQSD